ncbi:hypothetical protein BSIN_2529 [Burkholderia singularis]|uniref:Uncharacterized protein n=1 Tax=Burkholderia singularis TaxID=1503053 RepID=A0A238H2I8_9BURK|nr:hypothetical protein BSIN_2529 [Burkholderia singularis]
MRQAARPVRGMRRLPASTDTGSATRPACERAVHRLHH